MEEDLLNIGEEAVIDRHIIEYLKNVLDLQTLKQECSGKGGKLYHESLEPYRGTRLPALATFGLNLQEMPKSRQDEMTLLETMLYHRAYKEAVRRNQQDMMDTTLYYLGRAVRDACGKGCLDDIVKALNTHFPGLI